MVDVLAAMEKRSLIDSEQTWIALRSARNDLSHTYRDDPADAARHLNEALRRAPELLNILERVRAYVMRRGLTDLPLVPLLDPRPPAA
jgi:UTP:GlnB (protein PII) uridylyltransferase